MQSISGNFFSENGHPVPECCSIPGTVENLEPHHIVADGSALPIVGIGIPPEKARGPQQLILGDRLDHPTGMVKDGDVRDGSAGLKLIANARELQLCLNDLRFDQDHRRLQDVGTGI